MSAPDISREACEWAIRMNIQSVAALASGQKSLTYAALIERTILALRAALDAAERERDEARNQANVTTKLMAARGTNLDYWEATAKKLEAERDAADATGYARGVRDAAERGRRFGSFYITEADASAIHDAILALLPKEKNDAR
jgi:hypothetical protein